MQTSHRRDTLVKQRCKTGLVRIRGLVLPVNLDFPGLASLAVCAVFFVS
jgi:hypothetical protein